MNMTLNRKRIARTLRTAANFDLIPWDELDSDIENRFNEAG